LTLAAAGLAIAAFGLASGEPVETSIVAVRTAGTTGAILIPTAAHLSGAANSFWVTDGEVHNYGTVSMDYRMDLLKRDNANTSPMTKTFSIPAGQAVRFNDILLAQFAYTGAAALLITPLGATDGALIVTSRTYNDPEYANSPPVDDIPLLDQLALAGGTYGQFVPGQPVVTAITELDEGRIVQLTHTAGTTATGFRTNIGAVNTTGEAITVEIELRLADGTSLGTVDMALRAFEYKQIDKIYERVTSQTVADGFAVLRLKSGTGGFIAYASVIDNRTGDPIYVPATRVPRPAGAPAFSSLTFGTEVDASWHITNPGTSFPAGTNEVYVSYSYTGLTVGDTYTTTWYRNGTEYTKSTSTVHGSSGSVTTRIATSTQFATGTYRVEIVYHDVVMTSGQYTIGL
jgi:hypothetical protein